MTNRNKEKILSLISRSHIGDTMFEKKYCFKIDVGKVTEENLDEKNRLYQEQFYRQLEQKLEEDNLPDQFFYDLLFNTPSIPGNV